MYDNLSCVHKDNNTATEQVKAPVKAPKKLCGWNMLLTAKYVVQQGTVSMHMDVYGRRCSYVLFELYMMSEFVPFVCAIRSLFLYLSGP